ncbi:MAG: preprotein translocase subunit SecY [Lachnospiraceae bacterium]|nr:preprotein translocase subunit SecY [Lachnospiraceae bacterium]MBR4606028.1 preprotein translocase subunit SecY [Lachnospiraceae bacterium]MBR6151501.1 preprotein translocase subunit SecY [Lachnospiraceae bacterium]
MLTTLKNAFKIKELRNKLLFTLGMLVVIRIGSQVPAPGINGEVFRQWFEQNTADSFSFFDAITGGSFSQMAVLALGINPYITSSIIMQLMTIAIPKLEELQNDGEDGRKKIASITRYVTVLLALIQSVAMVIGFGYNNYLTSFDAFTVIIAVSALTAGSAFLMWIGERITEKGIGNGISIVLVINIVSRMPADIAALFDQFVWGHTNEPATAVLNAVIIIAVILAVVVMVVLLNSATRKIPVQYAKKMQGRKMVGGQTSNIPLRVNTAGVIPVIFASSIMQLPILIFTFLQKQPSTGVGGYLYGCLRSDYWCKPGELKYSVGLLVYVILIVFFAYFYTSITFNPLMVADNMKKQGGFIPGIRPGKPTSDYLTKVLNYIIFIGAIGLTIVSVIPYVFQGVFGAKVSFGGTSLIIVVSVVLETLKQAESLMLVRNYKGFLQD